jgi:hypothetical protein
VNGIQHLFFCSICNRDVFDFASRNGRDRHIPPVCRSCERHYGERSPSSGAFMDRRLAVQVSALANALAGIASCMEWERTHYVR